MARDLPILFSEPMVLALLAGSKTETRRLLYALRKSDKPMAGINPKFLRGYDPPAATTHAIDEFYDLRRQFAPGDRLWVREAWRVSATKDATAPRDIVPRICTTLYEAGGSMGGITPPPKDSPRPPREYVPDEQPLAGRMPEWVGRRRASMHMPRWASRITLPVSGVHVERLQAITEEAALAEGVVPHPDGGFHVVGVPHPNPRFPYLSRPTAREMYAALWDVINGPGAWAANPWVSATRFGVIHGNIDNV
ncbi:MAG: hypothetical protein DI527_00500 [Chelatococcus sp.]|nr:MAG: hypothetical protein DI527_00500 [Chelatococcus sp.]